MKSYKFEQWELEISCNNGWLGLTLRSDDLLMAENGLTILTKFIHSELRLPPGTIMSSNLQTVKAWIGAYDSNLISKSLECIKDFFSDPLNLKDEIIIEPIPSNPMAN
jgi:hypothetical protein